MSPAVAVFLKCYIDSLKLLGVEVTGRYSTKGKFVSFLKDLGVLRDKGERIETLFSKFAVPIELCKNSVDVINVTNQIVPHILNKVGATTDLKACLDWVVVELIDNAASHGYRCYDKSEYTHPIYVSAYEHKGSVEIGICDRGQGIRSSLEEKHTIESPKVALRMAIQEGISGHPDGSPGFGLWGSSELARRGGGEFRLWSSGANLSIVSGKQTVTGGFPHFGTLICLKFNKNAKPPFQKIVKCGTVDEYLDYVKELDFNDVINKQYTEN